MGFEDGYEEVLSQLPDKLLQLDAAGQTGDLQLTISVDNQPPSIVPSQVVERWNQTWETPALQLSLCGEFLAAQAAAGAQLPLVHGDWTNYWSMTAADFPAETILQRETRRKLEIAESLLVSLKPGQAFPRDAFDEAWEKLRGTAADEAQAQYVELVRKLGGAVD